MGCLEEPDREEDPGSGTNSTRQPEKLSCLAEFRSFVGLCSVPSFLVLLGQGIFGCIAMFAKGFGMLYLKHCGFSGPDIGIMSFAGGIAGFVAAPLNGAI